MLPLKKIYIDSRDRTVDSKSASNFKIELPNTVQMPENTVFFVTDVCVPHVWKTVEDGFNDSLFLSLDTYQSDPLRHQMRILSIPPVAITSSSLCQAIYKILAEIKN